MNSMRDILKIVNESAAPSAINETHHTSPWESDAIAIMKHIHQGGRIQIVNPDENLRNFRLWLKTKPEFAEVYRAFEREMGPI